VARCKNYFALGLMYWLYSRPVEQQLAAIERKFAKRPEIAAANQRVFKAGHAFATPQVFSAVRVPRRGSPALPDRRGNRHGPGFAAVAKQRPQAFLGSYPSPRLRILQDVYFKETVW
jgi:2-oxoglutarate ferredoxin oxidoreductase subunit alpha